MGSAGPYSEKRTTPRYTFVAVIEIVDPVSALKLNGRVSELSRKGCYVDILNTLPKGTPVEIRIARDAGAFASSGQIIYVQEGMGMGIAFSNPKAEQLQTLDVWLAELAAS